MDDKMQNEEGGNNSIDQRRTHPYKVHLRIIPTHTPLALPVPLGLTLVLIEVLLVLVPKVLRLRRLVLSLRPTPLPRHTSTNTSNSAPKPIGTVEALSLRSTLSTNLAADTLALLLRLTLHLALLLHRPATAACDTNNVLGAVWLVCRFRRRSVPRSAGCRRRNTGTSLRTETNETLHTPSNLSGRSTVQLLAVLSAASNTLAKPEGMAMLVLLLSRVVLLSRVRGIVIITSDLLVESLVVRVRLRLESAAGLLARRARRRARTGRASLEHRVLDIGLRNIARVVGRTEILVLGEGGMGVVAIRSHGRGGVTLLGALRGRLLSLGGGLGSTVLLGGLGGGGGEASGARLLGRQTLDVVVAEDIAAGESSLTLVVEVLSKVSEGKLGKNHSRRTRWLSP